METRHVKLDYESALSAKKHLLSSELNLLQIIKKINAYKLLRKQELITKTKLKKEIISFRTKIKYNRCNISKSTF